MYIKTKTFNISENELNYLLKISYYTSRKPLIIIFSILTVISIIIAIIDSRFTFLPFYFTLLLALFIALPSITNFAKSQPRFNFLNRFCEIDDNYFTINYDDGSLDKLNFNHFLKVVRRSEHYLLYVTKISFQYVPIRAFNSEEDINKFEKLVKIKKLME